MQSTKWVYEHLWISKVKVFHWLWSEITQSQHFQPSFPWNYMADWSQISCGVSMGWGMKVSIQMVYVAWPKWPPVPYMLKTLKNFLLWNQKVDDLESWYVASSAQVLRSLFKWWPWVDLDFYYGKVKFDPLGFCMEKVETMDFSETIVSYNIKVGRCSQLNEHMKLYEYQRSRSFTDLGPNHSDSSLSFFS